MKIGIVDYNVGNINSVANALSYLGFNFFISSNGKEILQADFIILPGVGSFAGGMENIEKLKLFKPIQEAVLERRKPILGICLGMQLLATQSEENGVRTGFNFIPGQVRKIPAFEQWQVPNVGWRTLGYIKEAKFFGENPYFYFDHSFHFIPENKEHSIASISYGKELVAMIRKENVFGVQFHPEKSQIAGLRLLKNILKEGRSVI